VEHEVKRLRLGELGAVFGIEGAGVFHPGGGFAEQFGIFQPALGVKLDADFAGAFRGFTGLEEDAEGIAGFLAGAIFRAGPGVNNPGLWFDVVGAESLLGEQAVAHRIAEGIHVAARLPDRGVHDDGGVETDHVLTLTGHGTPPSVAEVALELGPERAVIPEAIDAPVNLGTLKNEAASLAERNDFFHQRGLFWLTHRNVQISIGRTGTQLQTVEEWSSAKIPAESDGGRGRPAKTTKNTKTGVIAEEI